MIDKVRVLATPTTAIAAETASIAVAIVVIRSSTLVTEARLSALTKERTLISCLRREHLPLLLSFAAGHWRQARS